jgi:hypothetical protein
MAFKWNTRRGLLNPPPSLSHTHTKTNLISVGPKDLKAVRMSSSIYWDIWPCSPLKVNLRFEGTYRLHLQGVKVRQARSHYSFMLNYYLIYFLTLKTDAINYSKMPLNIYWTTRGHVPQVSTRQIVGTVRGHVLVFGREEKCMIKKILKRTRHYFTPPPVSR